MGLWEGAGLRRTWRGYGEGGVAKVRVGFERKGGAKARWAGPGGKGAWSCAKEGVVCRKGGVVWVMGAGLRGKVGGATDLNVTAPLRSKPKSPRLWKPV